MKFFKIVLLIVVAISLSTPLFAIERLPVKKNTHWGIKLGLNISNFDVEYEDKSDLFSPAFSIYGSDDIFTFLYYQLEACISQKGVQVLDQNDEENVTLTYLELPVTVKYLIPLEGIFSPYVYAGPAVALLFSAKYESIDIKDYVNKFDVSAVFGIGTGIDAGKGKVLVDLRFIKGFQNLEDIGTNDVPSHFPEIIGDQKITNITYSLSIGYEF